MDTNTLKSKAARFLAKPVAAAPVWKEERRWALLIFATSLIGIVFAQAVTGQLSAAAFGAFAGIYCAPLALIYLAARVWQAHRQEAVKRIDTIAQMFLWALVGFLAAFFFTWDEVFWILDRSSFVIGQIGLFALAHRPLRKFSAFATRRLQ